jgi:hypothetical protein
MFRTNAVSIFRKKNGNGDYDENITLKIMDRRKYRLTSARIYGVIFVKRVDLQCRLFDDLKTYVFTVTRTFKIFEK